MRRLGLAPMLAPSCSRRARRRCATFRGGERRRSHAAWHVLRVRQTGSGKTVTMGHEGRKGRAPTPTTAPGCTHVADELFQCVSAEATRGTRLVVRFVEIYRGKCFDFCSRRKRKIEVMEDETGQQCLVGLSWIELPSAGAMMSLLRQVPSATPRPSRSPCYCMRMHVTAMVSLHAQAQRTTRATVQNEQSSRSHAILQIAVLEPPEHAWQQGAERCKLSLVDLAGSEWAAKAQSDDRPTASTAPRSTRACCASRSASALSVPTRRTCPSEARS